MKTRDERAVCNPTSQVHTDAVRIVEHLLDHNGQVVDTQEGIARKLAMFRDHGGGVLRIDTARFHRARNHMRDRVDANGRPCCGFTIHYRKSGPNSHLALIDPSGDLGDHALAAKGLILGWASREKQHKTENLRMTETAELLGDHALALGDKQGYRLMQRVSIELERDGTITAATMADLEVWLSGMAA